MLSFENIVFDYDPYPIGVASPVIEDQLYREMLGNFPPIELFNSSDYHGRKYFLSKKHNRREYEDFIASQPVWREFRRYIRSDDFIFSTIDMLRAHHIDLGLTRANMGLAARSVECCKHLLNGHLPSVRPALTGRLEFSALPADGGKLFPHTDTAKKVITLVVSMVGEGEWNPEFGGGSEVMRPKDMSKNYNFLNAQLSFEEVEKIKVFDFKPNQLVIFVKTFNSLHGVRPMTGHGSDLLRRHQAMHSVIGADIENAHPRR